MHKILALAKNKLEKVFSNGRISNVFQPTFEDLKSGFSLKESGSLKYLKTTISCRVGKRRIFVGLQENILKKTFWVDVKGARMWKGASDSVNDGIANVAFLRTRIEFIEYCFENELMKFGLHF